jgi:hypothetical protein
MTFGARNGNTSTDFPNRDKSVAAQTASDTAGEKASTSPGVAKRAAQLIDALRSASLNGPTCPEAGLRTYTSAECAG